MYINSVRVHQIVAEAFLEPKPSSTHVIDHKDTNKCNNRPDNLRWATRLENALNNPITRKRIILCCGSIENFLENPALLRAGSVDQNFDWMRTVSPDEAKISKEKLERWAKEDSVPTGNGKLGPINHWRTREKFIAGRDAGRDLSNTENYGGTCFQHCCYGNGRTVG